MGIGSRICIFSFVFVFCCYLPLFCSASSSISQGQSIQDGETLISDGQNFELGFFSPGNSSFRYVGIRYYNISDPPVIWVANKENPISGEFGVLKIGSDGNLVVLDGNGTAVWSTNASTATNTTATNTTATLSDEGSLVLSGTGDAGEVYWQSFDHPADTFLPGMKVEVNDAIGENRFLSSWKSESDPSAGGYSMGVDPRGSPQFVIWEGSERRWRSGHWNKQIFIGMPTMPTSYESGFRLSDENANGSSYFTFKLSSTSEKLRFRIGWDGYEELLRWVEEKNQWEVIESQPNKTNQCEFYNKCGKFGVCSASDDSGSICSCMHGFQPRDSDQWMKGNWSEGCLRKTLLQCQRNSTNGTAASDEKDGFVGIRGAKLPDFADLVNAGPGEGCEGKCLENCSCTAYAFVEGIGCMMWTGDLIDVEQFTLGGNTLQIRVAHSDLGKVQIQLSFFLLVLLLSFLFLKSICVSLSGFGLYFLYKKNQRVNRSNKKKLSTVVIAVISVAGAVFVVIILLLLWWFKAKLKVLPISSSISWLRGSDTPMLDAGKSEEFSTDTSGSVNVFAQGNQANGSELPLFNFNPAKQALLDWRKRFTIIEGIARGLLYLLRDSRLGIIHRDLKASNILLDDDMIPKILDFGMARIFGAYKEEETGYIAPEYAIEGLFSVKPDVYSFGVLLLEIAWHLWNENRAADLINPSITETCSDYQTELLRCIQVGVSCVQDSAASRPTMAAAVLMLESEIASLLVPVQPIFTSILRYVDTKFITDGQDLISSNFVTITMLDGRLSVAHVFSYKDIGLLFSFKCQISKKQISDISKFSAYDFESNGRLFLVTKLKSHFLTRKFTDTLHISFYKKTY
ncbi:hypothetical protein DVH24_011623 [Malus domestica]|uniref:Receptor-like serine/threonine-protein kinase n=1 Tax=Malus domestica TaxID=3750 RepID=A0A498JTV7_MALDO|nr:hypothetical protein DVH24_011623 [Malus domestica]